MVNWFRLCRCFPVGMFLFISRPLHWIQPTAGTSVSIAKPDVKWSAFAVVLSRTSGMNFSWIWEESLTDEKLVRNVLKPEDAGLVFLCLNVIMSTFQPLRRPPEPSSKQAAGGFTAVLHSRHLAGSVDETVDFQQRLFAGWGSSEQNRRSVSFQRLREGRPSCAWTETAFQSLTLSDFSLSSMKSWTSLEKHFECCSGDQRQAEN